MSTDQFLTLIGIVVALVAGGFAIAGFFREPRQIIIQRAANPQEDSAGLKAEREKAKAEAEAARLEAERVKPAFRLS